MRKSPQFSIRNIQANDIIPMFKLGNELFTWPTEKSLWNKKTVRWYYEHSKAHSFVALKNQVVIGFALCYVVDAVGHIEWIAVSSRYQNQGVASELLRHVLMILKINKVPEVITMSREDGFANIFFSKHGFRDIGFRKTELRLNLRQVDAQVKALNVENEKLLFDNVTEYDKLANIYDRWASADPAFEATQKFYVNLGYRGKGIVVELGVGTGRISIEIAKKKKNIIGVDNSYQMIKLCREKSISAGVSDYINLIHSDILSLKLKNKANLIFFPFRTFGHFLTLDEKKQALQAIYSQLRPGGVFVFDHYVIDEDWAKNHNGIPRLMYSDQSCQDGGIFIWDTYSYDFLQQRMDCIITIERSDNEGYIVEKVHCPLTFSWVNPEQVRELALDVGFEIEALYGDFNYNEFNDASTEQVWFLRRPHGGN